MDVDKSVTIAFSILQAIGTMMSIYERHKAGKITDEEAWDLLKAAGPEFQKISDAPWDAPETD